MWAKIITIKRTNDLNYFSLCALNLFNTRVSQFELNYWNKLTFPWHSNLLRCSCICVCVCVCVYYFNPVSLFVYLLIFMFFLLQGVLPIVTFSIHISLVFAHALISQPEAWWETNHESRKLCQVCLLINLLFLFIFMEYYIFFARSCLMCISMIKICINTRTFHLNFWMHFSMCLYALSWLMGCVHLDMACLFLSVSKISGFPHVQHA